MEKTIKQLAVLSSIIAILMLPYFVFASTALDRLKDFGSDSGYSEATDTTMSTYIGQIVNVFMSTLGMIFVILILYGGYHWMTAAGEEGKVEKAIDTIKRAVIGLIIVISAWAITMFVMLKVINA